MLSAPTEDQQRIDADSARLREQIECLRAEVAELRSENRRLRSALDAHIARAGSPSLFGPLELTAGTCVGPRRRGVAADLEGGRDDRPRPHRRPRRDALGRPRPSRLRGRRTVVIGQ